VRRVCSIVRRNTEMPTWNKATLPGIIALTQANPTINACPRERIQETPESERGQPSPRELELRRETRGQGCPRSSRESALACHRVSSKTVAKAVAAGNEAEVFFAPESASFRQRLPFLYSYWPSPLPSPVSGSPGLRHDH
jgi:hypothetical protein